MLAHFDLYLFLCAKDSSSLFIELLQVFLLLLCLHVLFENFIVLFFELLDIDLLPTRYVLLLGKLCLSHCLVKLFDFLWLS